MKSAVIEDEKSHRDLLVSWLAGPAAGERAAHWTGAVAASALAAGIAYVIWRTGGSLWLFPALCASVDWGMRSGYSPC